jgi:uncharacterized membrane protein
MDLRLPIGLVFTIYGLLLSVYGLFTKGSAMYAKSLNININTGWGIVMLIFGLIMLLLAKREKKS